MTNLTFDKLPGYIWMNGQFINWSDAKVHVINHAMHYASSVFEGNRAYNGKIFKLEQHTERLFKSAEILDMEIPHSVAEINQACVDILAKQGLKSAYLRPIVWRGSEQMGISAQNTTINVAIAVWEWPSYFSLADTMKGIRLTAAKYRRPAPDTAPFRAKAAGLYMICTLSKHAAEAKGYNDALMLDHQGNIAESTGSNIFFVKNGELHTPDPTSFLDGITRQTVIQLAQQAGIKVVVRDISPSELPSFDECFLCGTAMEIMPVAEIDEHRFTPAGITQQLIEAYIQLHG
ncbi:MAG: branched-chain amino acid aminotransferase [Rhizobiales bacterium]|nr:branched-chain amino acid aminotransferase [Hyphomicrobiales bacterium]NRB14063.1 branched-chain amino acid aminotransferase [Hyphomicrobiales bacterium]